MLHKADWEDRSTTGGACVSMGAYSFARSACSFFGNICSMAPLSSKMGYEAHILAAQNIDSPYRCLQGAGLNRRLEFGAEHRQSVCFAPLMPLCIDDFTWFCVEMSSNVKLPEHQARTTPTSSALLKAGLHSYNRTHACLLICPLTV